MAYDPNTLHGLTSREPDDERLLELSRMWREGMKVREIAAETGLPLGTVCAIAFMHRDLFPWRGKGPRKTIVHEEQ